MKRAILVLAALLAAPVAAATQASGDLLVTGETRLPQGSHLDFHPLAGMTREPSFSEASLHAQDLRVDAFFRNYSVVTTPAETVEVAPATDGHSRLETRGPASLVMRGSRDGFVGLYPEPSTRVETECEAALHPSNTASLSVDAGNTRPTDGTKPDYHRVVEGPHLRVQCAGALRVSGPFRMAVLGPTIRVDVPDGHVVLDTGFTKTEETGVGPVGTYAAQQVWALVHVPEGVTLTIENGSAWTFATYAAEGAWAGAAALRSVEGSIETAQARYAPRARVEVLDGAFEVELLAVRLDEGVVVQLRLEGRLSQTTMPPEAFPMSDRVARSPLLPGTLLLAGAVVATAGFAAGLALRRRDARPTREAVPYSVEDCVARASEAMAAGAWAEAHEWYERAHRLAPSSGAICENLALACRELGNPDEALRLLEAAWALRPDAEPAFQGALTALAACRSEEEVEAWLERALSVEPSLVATLEEDDVFSCLEGRPRYAELVEQAWRAVHARGLEPGS